MKYKVALEIDVDNSNGLDMNGPGLIEFDIKDALKLYGFVVIPGSVYVTKSRKQATR